HPAVEAVSPFHHRRVVVRMGDCDRPEPAARLDERRHPLEQGQAVPEDVAARRLEEQRALADPEAGLRADARQPRLLLADVRAVRRAHVVVLDPLLSLDRYVLPLVLADRACARRLVGLLELRPARLADEPRHRSSIATVPTCRVCGNMTPGLARTSR